MKLKLWIGQQTDDAAAYNVVAKTKKEAQAQMIAKKAYIRYEALYRVEIEYQDAFDLFKISTGEWGGRYPETGAYDIISKYNVEYKQDPLEGCKYILNFKKVSRLK